MVFKKLFQALTGSGSKEADSNKAASADPITYKDITITAKPLSEGGQFKTAGTISQSINGELKSTEFIRADNHSSFDAAVEHSVNKAKQIIDERGSSLFDSERC